MRLPSKEGLNPARFSILEHDWPALHWDLFLEERDHLLNWRLLADPRLEERIPTEIGAPHRKIYLDYEGPISGGRGLVKSIDRGEYLYLTSDGKKSAIQLLGQVFQRSFEFRQIEGQLYFCWLLETNREL